MTEASRNVIGRYALLAIACTLLGMLAFVFISYSQDGVIPAPGENAAGYLRAITCTLICGILVYTVDQQLDKLIHWKASFMLRFISGLITHIILVIAVLGLAANFWFHAAAEQTLKIIILFTISVFIYEIFYGVFYSYQSYATAQAESLRSDRWQMELQFESLKNQISPHYLFNCLNTVSALLYKDTRVAEEFIRRMADTFRYVLAHQQHKLVSLREELEFVRSYYFLLQVRYEYHLQLEINVPQNLMETLVPPMTLQLLVENAVKHNAISKEQPLLVYISAKDNTHLNIYNTKTTTLKPMTSFRVGLDNIRSRYSFFTDQKIMVRDEDRFTVQLPIIKANHQTR